MLRKFRDEQRGKNEAKTNTKQIGTGANHSGKWTLSETEPVRSYLSRSIVEEGLSECDDCLTDNDGEEALLYEATDP